MPELKLYTVAQLRDWVMHNDAFEGLSDTLISRTRAWAIVHNPYVRDDDPVVAAIFVDNVNVAYTTAFPEMISDHRYWWFSALWCDPKYQGNGYGLIVIGSLAEVYGTEFCLDRWGAKETVEIFTYLGHNTVYSTRSIFGVSVQRSTLKGKCIYYLRKLQTKLHRAFEMHPHENYTLRYIPYIDDETYAFIGAHSANDYLHHTQAFLNWGVQYSYTQSAPLIGRVMNKMPFSQSELQDSQSYAVKVIKDDMIIGFYIMKKKEEGLHILYLYFDDAYKNQVFASIRDHINCLHIERCITENKALAEYLRRHIYFPKYSEAQVSFSYPATMPEPQAGHIQYGDGDCFVA